MRAVGAQERGGDGPGGNLGWLQQEPSRRGRARLPSSSVQCGARGWARRDWPTAVALITRHIYYPSPLARFYLAPGIRGPGSFGAV